MPKLIASHKARIGKDKDFQYIREDIAEFKAQRKKNQVTLNEADRRKEREVQEARMKLREKDDKKDSAANAAGKGTAATGHASLQDDGLFSSERNLDADLAIEEARKNIKDPFLNEAVHILSDEIGLLQSDSRLAARVLPRADVH